MSRLVLVVVLLTACGAVAPKAAIATPSPQASPSPTLTRSDFLAIVGGPKNTAVSLVASDGTVIATAPVDLPTFWMHALMSWTSASRTRLYYLDGSEVRFLAPDGSTGLATKIAFGPTEQAGFAVSPDDASIAVSVFSYTQASGPPSSATYKGMRSYVEDLHGGGHHVDIFSSTTVAEFPVGWTGGRLILAVSEPKCCKALTVNPYDATSYHVVDPATGTRLASLCNNTQGPEGPIEPIGATCYPFPYGAPIYQRWDGSRFDSPAAVPDPSPLNAVSPDGTRIAGSPCCYNGNALALFGPRGQWVWLHQTGYVMGWLDAHHIVIQPVDSPAISVIEVGQGPTELDEIWSIRSNTEIAPGGSYLGTFPAAVT